MNRLYVPSLKKIRSKNHIFLPPLSTIAIGRKALEIESQRVHGSSFEFEEVCKKSQDREFS